MTKKINETEFKELVIQSGKPVVVDFSATWCGPCKKLKPILTDLATELNGKVEFFEVDAGETPQIAQEFGVMSLPTTLFFKDGKVADSIIGLTSKNKIMQKIEKIL